MISISLLVATILLVQTPGASEAERENPIFRDLLANGLTLDGRKVPLPVPSLRSDATKQEEREVLKKITKDGKVALEEFILPAVNAMEVGKSDFKKVQGGVIWRYDFWFIVYGPLKAIDTSQGLNKNSGPQVVEKGDVKVTSLVIEGKALADRGIKPEKSARKQEIFDQEKSELFGKVDVHSTNHTFATLDDDSWLIACKTDPRFNDDPKLANQWQPLDDGKKKRPLPAAQKYDGGGGYAKVTKLKTVYGAMLVEVHFVYFEPKGWEAAGELLDGKIPAIAKAQIRTLREDVEAKYPLPAGR